MVGVDVRLQCCYNRSTENSSRVKGSPGEPTRFLVPNQLANNIRRSFCCAEKNYGWMKESHTNSMITVAMTSSCREDQLAEYHSLKKGCDDNANGINLLKGIKKPGRWGVENIGSVSVDPRSRPTLERTEGIASNAYLNIPYPRFHVNQPRMQIWRPTYEDSNTSGPLPYMFHLLRRDAWVPFAWLGIAFLHNIGYHWNIK